MESIKIKNLRSFSETTDIDLNKLNILVGKNSCGKSTLLRIFPLLKQTLEEKTSEPVLWYGRYVDFGDFNQSINKNKNDKSMEFFFKFQTSIKKSILFSRASKDKHFELGITFNQKMTEEINLKIEQDKINIKLLNNKAQVTINDSYSRKGLDYIFPNNNLIPMIGKINDGLFLSRYFLNNINEENLRKEFHSITKVYFDDILNLKDDQGADIYEIIFLCLSEEIFSASDKEVLINDFNRNLSKVLDEFLTSEEVEKILNVLNENYVELRQLVLYLNLNVYLRECEDYLCTYFKNVSYIAPLRATAERYYRIQGLSVNEIDPRGANVAMILTNMNPSEREAFQHWTKSSFGFEIEIIPSGGHISINIIINGKKNNIADTGFGFSQIIPIILMLWKTKKLKSKKRTIVIEQPEVHLHPKMQTQLMDVVLEIIRKSENIIMIIETHSQTIINHLGKRLEGDNLLSENINIFLINQDEEGNSNIKLSSYNKEGYLENWPIGFFNGVE